MEKEIQEERETMTGFLGQVTQLIGTEKVDTRRESVSSNS